ncbi:transposase [Ferruginibacter sp.]|uniref:transposase n=2 Tax=Ferruginibacter sp. TaxID=1940288 RepID=UPI00265B29C5|nr:transposase [Ferruginibacter sp.]
MLSNKKQSPQIGLFNGLADQLDQKHPLYQLANRVNWSFFENAFKKHYHEKMGAPAKPIRLMVSLLIIKSLRNLSDENLIEQWAENIYCQYIGGEQHFQPSIPCVPTELVAFRQRIGEPGVELILQESIRINKAPKDNNDSDIVKGKEHKKFEFGSKVSITISQSTGIIMGAINFTQTLYDSKTIPEVLEQFERLNGRQAKDTFADRRYRGIKQYKGTTIHMPVPDKNITKAKRKKHSRRAAIESVTGHLQQDYRLCRNYLKGIIGDNMNVIFSAAGMNFKRAMIPWRTEAIRCWLLICKYIVAANWNFFAPNLKLTF